MIHPHTSDVLSINGHTTFNLSYQVSCPLFR